MTFADVAEYSGILPDLAGSTTEKDAVDVIAAKIAETILPSAAAKHLGLIGQPQPHRTIG